MKPVCGIDFGTSNSTVGVCLGGKISMIPVEGAQVTIPSAIFYPAAGTAPIYGRAAIEAYTLQEPGRLMRSLKSILGSTLVAEKTAVGGQYVSFEDILVGFVKHLKRKAEFVCGETIDEVVMGRPVHFVDNDAAADERAQDKLQAIAKKSGFKTVLFQFEPIAAALQFEETLTRDETVFIADIGGGTSDFSILKTGPRHKGNADRSHDILANEGVRVGGTNLDMRLSVAAVMPLLGAHSRNLRGLDLPIWPFIDLATWHRIHMIASPDNMSLFRQILTDARERHLFERFVKVIRERTGHEIAGKVEGAKIALSQHTEAGIDLAVVEEGLVAPAKRDVLETSTRHELERVEASVKETLHAAGLQPEQITAVFLTGGTSAVPIVREALVAPFAKARVVEGDLFSSVGYGMALDAMRRFGRTDKPKHKQIPRLLR